MPLTDEEIRLRLFEAILRKDGYGGNLPIVACQVKILAEFIKGGPVPSLDHFETTARDAGAIPSEPPGESPKKAAPSFRN